MSDEKIALMYDQGDAHPMHNRFILYHNFFPGTSTVEFCFHKASLIAEIVYEACFASEFVMRCNSLRLIARIFEKPFNRLKLEVTAIKVFIFISIIK